jgi:hypothetical protein
MQRDRAVVDVVDLVPGAMQFVQQHRRGVAPFLHQQDPAHRVIAASGRPGAPA